MRNKVLFILKKRQDFDLNKFSHIGLTTGLYNSSSFMVDMLNDSGIESKMVVVLDNNDIDREVSKYKPTHVIIEALWVVPTKFNVLCKIHPKVKWIVRLHSEIPFISNEGMALDWIGDYVRFKNVFVAPNSHRCLEDIKGYIKSATDFSNDEVNNKVIYLPNYYPKKMKTKKFDRNKKHIDISCFGAIRPLKNHIMQALAAIKFADSIGKKLRFHINVGRYEMKGQPVMSNLEALFFQISDSGHVLVKHEWSVREEFIKICSKMDMGMQVSFSETFNIVGADLLSQGVPLVASKELPWINRFSTANPTNTNKIYKKLLLTYLFPQVFTKINQYLLNRYTNKTKKIWKKYFKQHEKR